MNVSRNAYFTSEYLQERQQKNHRLIKPTDFSRAPRSEAGTERSRTPISNNPELVSPKEETFNVEPEDDLGKEITPAELNYLASHPKPRRSQRKMVDYYDYYAPRETRRISDTQKTNTNMGPRKVKIFKRKTSENDFPYDANDEIFFHGDDTSLYEPSLPKQEPFSGYYIDQEKRLQSSPEFKRNTYTHKTFKDVFHADSDERLNPIDLVFDDPNKRDLKTKQKFSRAFKQVKKKLGKNDYASYEYNEQRENDEPVNLALKSPFDDSEWNDKSSEDSAKKNTSIKRTKNPASDIFTKPYSEEGLNLRGQTLEKRGLHNHLRRKWKKNKTVSETSSQVGPEEVEIEETHPDIEYLSRDESESNLDFSPEPEADNTSSPLWEYVLSWIASNEKGPLHHSEEPKITEIQDDISTITSEQEFEGKDSQINDPKNKKGKKYKKLLRNWNMPAAEYISSQEKSRAMVKAGKAGIEEKGNQEEEEQFILNKNTGQLEPVIVGEGEIKDNNMVAQKIHEGSPTMIISNINKLIKHIKIMRIIFAPIDVVAENFPQVQTFVIFIELFIFMWILYELSLLIDALCMAVKAVCAPMIAIGKFMNRIM